MRRIFLKDDLEDGIAEQGYVVVENFAPGGVCLGLSSFFEQTDSVDKRAFAITNWNNDIGYRNRAYGKIVAELTDLAGALLQDYKPVMAVFAAKRPGAKSEMLL